MRQSARPQALAAAEGSTIQGRASEGPRKGEVGLKEQAGQFLGPARSRLCLVILALVGCVNPLRAPVDLAPPRRGEVGQGSYLQFAEVLLFVQEEARPPVSFKVCGEGEAVKCAHSPVGRRRKVASQSVKRHGLSKPGVGLLRRRAQSQEHLVKLPSGFRRVGH